VNDTERTQALNSLRQVAQQYNGTVLDIDASDEYAQIEFLNLLRAAQFVEQRGLYHYATLREPATDFDASVVVRFKISVYGREIGIGA
jgi:hypothetical protein